ncbi:MAG: hypothetical protein M1821_008493 [Bathelium mastoideum]|nr:MAG: hypothetical protein M1821_008493 [Bathelium mastoideum]
MDGAKTTRRHTTEEGEDEISSKGLPARVQSDPEDSSPSTSKPAIVFRDAVDRKFKWPFDRCQKWKNVANLISEACSHIDAIGEHVNEGRYDLFDPEGYLILPSVWEDTIQPGWEISMRIWPIEDVTSANPPSPSACSDFSHSDKNEDDKFGPFMFPLDVAPLGKKRKKSKKSEATVQMRTQAVVRKRSKQALAPAKPPGGDIDTSDRIPMIEYGVDSMAPGDRQRLSPPHPLSPQIAMAQFERGVPQTPTFEQDQDRPKYDLAPILPPSPFHKAINAPFIDSNRQGVDELLPITVEPDLPLPHKRGKQNEAKNAEVEWAPILLERGRRTRTDATIGVVLPPEPLELAESVNEGENSADDSKGKLIWKMQRAMAAVLDKIGLGGAWSPGSLNMFSRIRSSLLFFVFNVHIRITDLSRTCFGLTPYRISPSV